MHPTVDCCNIGKVPKVSVQAHAFIMHAVHTNSGYECNKCMGLYGNLTLGSTVVARAAGKITNAGKCSQ